MPVLFFIFVLLPMIAVLGVLIVGIFGMAKGSEFERKFGNRLMQARVWIQAAAMIMFGIGLLIMKK